MQQTLIALSAFRYSDKHILIRQVRVPLEAEVIIPREEFFQLPEILVERYRLPLAPYFFTSSE